MKYKFFFIQFIFYTKFISFYRYFILFLLTITVSGCLSYVSTGQWTLHPGLFIMGFICVVIQTSSRKQGKIFLKSYYIDRYEVNASKFSKFLNLHKNKAPLYFETGLGVTIEKIDNLFRPRLGLNNYPANRISWYGANAYCRSVNKRLPTEAEWEKAARGTGARLFPWGDEFPSNNRATFRRKFNILGFKALESVDSMPKGRSPYGAHHMAGNVWEWVNDWYQDSYYEVSPSSNPKGPESGTSKVLRGGNWYYKAYYMRTTYRFNDKPDVFKKDLRAKI